MTGSPGLAEIGDVSDGGFFEWDDTPDAALRRIRVPPVDVYAMQKTTVHLPSDMKAAVVKEARRQGVSRGRRRSAIAAALSRPKPRGGLFVSAEPLAERADELLAGFGER